MKEEATLICEDVWLSRLFGDRMKTFDDYRTFAVRLKSVVGPLAIDLLHAGRSVVLDFPANTRATRSWFRRVFEQAGCGHVLHYVNVPDAVCLQQIGKRNAEQPEGSHQLTEADFAHITSFFEPPADDEGFHVKAYGPRAAPDSISPIISP